MEKNFIVMALATCAVLMTPAIGIGAMMTPGMTPIIGLPLMSPDIGLGNSNDSSLRVFRNNRFFNELGNDRFFRGGGNDRIDRNDRFFRELRIDRRDDRERRGK